MKDFLFTEKIESIKILHRIMIFAGSLILVTGLFLYFIYFPKTAKISKLQNDIKVLQKKVDIARETAANLPKFEAEEAKLDLQFKEALKLLPDKKEIPSLLKHINSLGKESGLKFRLFRPEKEKPHGFYFEIPISIEVSGKYFDVVGFFNKMSRLTRIVNVFDVSMKPEKALSTNIKTTFKAVTYRFREMSAKDATKKGKNKKRKRRKR
jgi:type IV pilus assembly protein PilO